jgi:hypothetical protein
MDLRNWEFYVDNGSPVVGANVYIRDAILTHPNTGTVVGSAITNSNGMWAVTGLTNTPKDVEVVWGNINQYHKWYKGMTQHNVDAIFFGSSGTVIKGKNRLINGSFPIWQRGTSGPTTTDNAYGPDRWRLLTEPGGVSTAAVISRSTTSDLGWGAWAAVLQIGATNNKKIGLFQPIESVDMWDMRGDVASLQFKASVSTARIGDVRVAVVQWTGTADAITADPINVWGAALTNPTYTGSWSNANTPVNMNVGTAAAIYKIENIPISTIATNLAVFIWIDDQSTTAGDLLLITDVQLEKGPIATEFERRPYPQELQLAKRFYERMGGVVAADIAYYGYGPAGGSTGATVFYAVEKRIVPAITKAGTWTVVNVAQPSIGATGRHGALLYATVTALGAAIFQTVDATTYLSIDAEL